MSQREYTLDDEIEPLSFALDIQDTHIYSYRDALQKNIALSEGKKIAGVVYLDATIQSALDWSQAYILADELVQQEKLVVFHLDLGLFDNLAYSLTHQGQFQSLALACDHFRKETVVRYSSSLLGVILYEGPLHLHAPKTHDYSTSNNDHTISASFLQWLEKHNVQQEKLGDIQNNIHSATCAWYYTRFCHEQCLDFLRLLSSQIPDTVHRFLLLDTANIHSFPGYELLIQTAKDLLDPMHAVIKKNPFLMDASAWMSGNTSCACCYYCSSQKLLSASFPIFDEKSVIKHTLELSSIGLLLPSHTSIPLLHSSLNNFISLCQLLYSHGQLASSIRVVHESYLTSEWHGLDIIIYSKSSMTLDGIRALKGFEAAGGTMLDIDATLPTMDMLHALCYDSSYKK